MFQVPRLSSGDNLTPEYLLGLGKAVRELQNLAITRVRWPLILQAGTLASINQRIELWIGIIDATDQTDYTDERYWVKTASCTNSTGDNTAQLTFAALDSGDARYQQVTATNLAELAGHTHGLAAGGVVVMLAVNDAQASPVKHYYFWQGGAGGFWAKITGNAEFDSPAQNRWTYAFSEVEKTSAGYDGWADVSGGRSGMTNSGPAWNTLEDMNTVDGVCGNGVDASTLDTDDYTYAIQPCPSGAIVWMREVPDGSTGTEYWFTYANGVDGTCD